MARSASVTAAKKVGSRHARVKDDPQRRRPATARPTTAASAASGIWISTAFKQARVYGVRMIAPEPEASCCCEGESRSASSGLIKGLRGEAPFDGEPLPAAAVGRPARRRGRHRVHRRLDRRRLSRATDELSARLEIKSRGVSRVKLAEVAEFDALSRRAPGNTPTARESRASAPMWIACRRGAGGRAAARLPQYLRHRRRTRRTGATTTTRRSSTRTIASTAGSASCPGTAPTSTSSSRTCRTSSPTSCSRTGTSRCRNTGRDEPDKGSIIPEALKAFLTEEQAEWLIGQLQPAAEQAAGGRLSRARPDAHAVHVAARVLLLRHPDRSVTPTSRRRPRTPIASA